MPPENPAGEPASPCEGLLELVSDAVLVVDPETLSVRAANDGASSVLGIDGESLVEADLEEVVRTATDDPPDRTALQSSITAEGETKLTLGTADGPARLELSARTVRANDDPYCLVAVHDHSERRSARHRRHRELLQTVTGEAPVCRVTITDRGHVAWAEGRAFDLAGLDPEAIIGEHYEEAFADDPSARQAISTALDSGTVVQRTTELGETAVELWLRPVNDDEAALVGTGMDVTSLNRSKDRIQALAEATREFQYADREREVARTVVDIARDVLGHSTAIVYQFDPDTELLVPWIHDGLEPGPDERGSYPDSRDSTSKNGSTIGTGSRRTDAGDESTRLAGGSDPEDAGAMGPDTWEMSVFEQGDPAWVLHYGDIENPGAPGRLDGGVLAVPLGEHGLFQVGIHGTTEFVTEDRTLVEILGRAARSALDRI